MVLSVSLLFLFNNMLRFVAVYVLCGISDMLDGYVARLTNTKSILGAKLDSAADLLFYCVLIYSAYKLLGARFIEFLPILITIAVIRCINILIALIKYHTFAVLHTILNKAAGLLAFLSLLFIAADKYEPVIAICIIALIAAFEETLIHITSDKLNVDRKSLFMLA